MIGQRDVEPEEWHHAELCGVHAYPCDSDRFRFLGRRVMRLDRPWQRMRMQRQGCPSPVCTWNLILMRWMPALCQKRAPQWAPDRRNPNVGPDLDVVSETLRCVVDEAASISLMEVGHLQDEEGRVR